MDTKNTAWHCYLVGGAIRDLLLGRLPTECDYTFVGSTTAFLTRFPKAHTSGKAFPIFRIDQHDFTQTRSANIEADILTRDLTINALALPLPEDILLPLPAVLDHPAWITVRQLAASPTLIAHPLALQDLHNKILRPTGYTAFTNDPVRALRAARFAASFPEFTPHPKLLTVMTHVGRFNLLATTAAERIATEVLKACATPAPGRFITLLAATGCLAPWLAELTNAHSIPAGPAPFHTSSLLDHLAFVMNRTAALKNHNPLTTWMALTHDLGKTATPTDQWPRQHNHDTLGHPLAHALGQRLKLPARYIEAGAFAARWHMTLARYHTLRPGTRVDLLTNLNSSRLTSQMLDLVTADALTPLPSTWALTVLTELNACLATTLPHHLRNLGSTSSTRLRELRCTALSMKTKTY